MANYPLWMNRGKPFKQFLACCFQESSFFFLWKSTSQYVTEARVTQIHWGSTVHIKEVYMQDVHTQQLNPPGEERRGYGKQCVAAFHRSVLFVSLIQLSGCSDVWEAHTVSCMHWHTPYHPSGRLLTPTSQIRESADCLYTRNADIEYTTAR